MLSLSFRDESHAVIEKAKAKQRKARARKIPSPNVASSLSSPRDVMTTGVSGTSSPRPLHKTSPAASSRPTLEVPIIRFEILHLVQDPISIPQTLAPDVLERGVSYFFSNFVAPPSGPSHGHFHHLTTISLADGLDDTLKTSLAATGLAGLANTSKSASLLDHARREYAAALRQINAALLSPTEAIKDSTLISIIVVAIFESTVGARQLSIKAWTEHINGAATLVQLRGSAQLRTRVGLGLFIQASSHMLISCMQRGIPIPPHITELRKEASSFTPLDPAWQFLRIVDELTNFRASIRQGSLLDSEEIIRRALELDCELVQVFASVDPEWLYETVYTDTNPEIIYNRRYDIYYDYWIAQIWNGMRLSRIMLNEAVRVHLLKGFTSTPPRFTTQEYTAQFQVSIDVITRMRDEILYSVPQSLGYVRGKPFQNPDFEHDVTASMTSNMSFTDFLSPGDHTGLTPPARPRINEPLTRSTTFPAIGGYYLLWPLFIAASTPLTPPPLRSFITSILRFIGSDMGLAQGNNLASFIETVPPRNHEQGISMPLAERTLLAK